MKKLMIAAAVVCAAVAANAAATVNWKTNYAVMQANAEDTTTAEYAWLIDASVLTQESIYNSVAGGKTLAQTVSGKFVKAVSMSDGAITQQSWTPETTGNSVSYYMVLQDDDLGGALYFSEQLTKTISAVGATTFGFKSLSSEDNVFTDMKGFEAANGRWVAIPEPTSAMLLLLGVAGLALRRRRA